MFDITLESKMESSEYLGFYLPLSYYYSTHMARLFVFVVQFLEYLFRQLSLLNTKAQNRNFSSSAPFLHQPELCSMFDIILESKMASSEYLGF